MSKLAKKLSRQILAIALSVAMILPNMTVYASEVSDPDSILPVSEVEADVEEPEIESAELSLTKEEIESDYTSKDLGNVVMTASGTEKVAEGTIVFESVETLPDTAGMTINNISASGNKHGIQASSNATIELALADDKIADISVTSCCFSSGGYDGAEITAVASDNANKEFTVAKEPINGVNGDNPGTPKFTIFKAEGDVTLNVSNGAYIHNITVTYYDESSYKEKHIITVTNDGKGTATAASDATKSNSSAFAEEGEEVTLTATATEDGYVFDKWEVVSGGVTVDNDKFTMGTSDVVVKATFKVGEDTNYVAAGEYIFGGQVDKDKGNGTAVAVTGIETDIKYHGSGHGLQAAKGSTMKLNLSGSAEIEIVGCKEGTGLSGTVTPSKGKVLGTETVNNDNETAPKHTIWVPEAGKVTLTFGESRESYIHKIKVTYTTTEKYSVKLTNDGHGTATATPPFGVAGTEINLIATPKTGYAFKEWKPADGTTLNITDNKFTLPASDVEIQAVFEKTGPRTEWDFTNTEDTTLYNANNSFQDTATIKSGELAGLQIDATASGAKFAPDSTNGYVQVNKDTKIKVPVANDSVKVTVQWNQPGAVYTVAGKTVTNEATQKVQTVECESTKEAASDDKYVEIVVTDKTEWLEIIKIEPIVYVASGTMTFTGGTPDDMADIPGLTTVVGDNGDFVKHDASHGYRTAKNGASLELNLKEKANITVQSCQHNNYDEMTASSGGMVLDDSVADVKFIVLGADKGPLTLTFPKSRVYIHSITVNYASDATGYEEKFAIKVTADDTQGSASANKIMAATGEEITLTAEAESGYKFKEWNVVKGGVEVVNNKFTVGTNHIEIQAVFELSGSRFEWDFANDATLTGTENGKVVESKKEEVADLTIDATAADSGWDSTGTDGWVVVKNGTKIEVPLDGVNAEECEDGKYRVRVVGESADYKVDGTAATKAGAESFFCEGTDGKVVIEATADNKINYIKVAPLVYVEAKTISFNTSDQTVINKTKGLTATNIVWHDSSHGLVAPANGTIELSLAKKANVSVVTCCEGVGSNGKIKASSGKISSVPTTETKGDMTGLEWTVLDAEKGDLTLTCYDYTGSMYIHSITVEYPQEILPGSRNIDVWDFAGKTETDTDDMKYNNNMTAETIKAANAIGSDGLFGGGGNAVFGDLTMFYNENDRFYSTVVTDIARTDSQNFVEVDYGDGYKSAGGFYCNGTGGSDRRYITISNVQAGDKIVAYMGLTNASSQYFFEGTGAADGQKDEVDADTAGGVKGFQKYEFVAEKTGTYKIWENKIGKPMYHRIVRVPGVAVSGTVDLGSYNVADYSVKFVNTTNQKETLATLDGNDFSAVLAPGFTYTAVLSGASGYGFTTESKMVTTADSEYKTGKSGIELVVETKDIYNYTGQIKGFATDYDIKDLDIIMVPPEGSYLDKIKLNIDENMNFSAVLESNVEYTIQLDGVDDYEVKNGTVINKNDDYNADIEVGLKPKYEVSGNFIVLDGSALPSSATVTSLKFAILDSKGKESAKYVYDATVADGGYSTELRNGEYIAKAVISGYTTTTHVVVNNAALERDLMFAADTVDTTPIVYAPDIYVGFKDKTENSYATVSAAMDACERMTRTTGQRVTVHIAPGVYREQIFVKAPNITFVNDTPGKQVLLTWYYGIGYKYYSADSKGYYNPQNAYDKHDKHIAEKWGVAVYVQSTATAFRAEGITFENSFNRYVTSEEIADGVEMDSIKFDRTFNADVESRSAIERAAAIIIEADKAEFKDCGFYSSQDTLYTAEADVHGYFKNCVIEGNTDYIFGGGNYVFDGCELSWKGYSDKTSQGGYITAVRPAAGNKGYLFRNCVITANEGYTVNPGYFGRNWGADAKVVMLNTKLEKAELIADAGWYKMNGDPALSNYFEYNTTTTAGVAVDTSKRVRGVIDAEAAAAYTAESFFGEGWTPEYYTAEAAGDVEFAADSAPKLSSNAAAGSASKPGNILTVSYSLGEANDKNDASIIQWYRVDGDGSETLIKTSNASDKTYLIDKVDVGKKIKVTVIPAVSSGKTGTSASDTMESNVEEGYDETVEFSILPSIASNANINVPHPDDILTVSYSLDAANISKDASKIEWYRVKDGEETKIIENTAPNKTYTITTADVGAVIKVYVTPVNTNGTSNGDAKASATLTNAVTARNSNPVNAVSEPYAIPDPKAGSVDKNTTVELKCTTGGASIYYNINNDSNPTAGEGTPYTTGIKITNSIIKDGHVIIKAIAVKDGLDSSKVATFNYTVSTGSNTPGGNGNGLEIILEEEDYTYTGSAIIPKYTVTYDGEPLIPGIEYTVKCSNNVKVADGKAKITVTGKGNLSGNTFKTFNIKQKSLAENDESGAGVVEGDKLVVVEGAKATPILTYNGKKLAANKDFEFADSTTYKNKKDWSSEDNGNTVTVKAKDGGSFKDSRDLTIVFVSKAAQKNAKLVVKLDNAANKNIIYDGTPKEAAFTVENKGKTKTLEKGVDYIVSYQSDIISAGKKTFTVTGISPDCVGTVTKTYTIKPAAKDETKVKVELDGTEVSVGNTKLKFVSTGVTFAKDALEVTYDGKELKQGVDYKITYGANKKVGTAKYTVTGLGNYKGVKKVGQFTIEAAAMSEENVTVIVSDVALGKSAKVYKSAPYVIENDTNTLLKASSYKVTYCSDAAGTTLLGKTSAAGTAYVKIEGKGGYDSSTSIIKPYEIKAVGDTVKDLSTAKITFYDAAGAAKPAKSFSYTGEPVQPYSMRITFKGKDNYVNVVLDKEATGFDSELYDKFDITFVNNTNKGKASVIVKADDDSYVGGKTATFSIAARNLKNFTWVSGSASSFIFDLFK